MFSNYAEKSFLFEKQTVDQNCQPYCWARGWQQTHPFPSDGTIIEAFFTPCPVHCALNTVHFPLYVLFWNNGANRSNHHCIRFLLRHYKLDEGKKIKPLLFWRTPFFIRMNSCKSCLCHLQMHVGTFDKYSENGANRSNRRGERRTHPFSSEGQLGENYSRPVMSASYDVPLWRLCIFRSTVFPKCILCNKVCHHICSCEPCSTVVFDTHVIHWVLSFCFQCGAPILYESPFLCVLIF